MKKILGIFVVFLLTWSVAFQINLEPSRMDVVLKAGSTLRKTMTLSNTDKDPVQVKVYLNDWTMKKNQKVFLEAGTTPYSLVNSIRLFPASFVLKGGESKEVAITMTSSGSEAGGQYGVVFFETQPLSKTKGSGLIFGGRIGCLIGKEIEGTQKRIYELKDYRSSLFAKKISFEFTLKSESNVMLRPSGTLVIYDNEAGKVVYKEVLSDISVFPGDTTFYKKDSVLPVPLKSPKGLSVLLTLDFGENEMLMKELKSAE